MSLALQILFLFSFYFGEPVEFDPTLSYGASSGAAGEKYLQLSYI